MGALECALNPIEGKRMRRSTMIVARALGLIALALVAQPTSAQNPGKPMNSDPDTPILSSMQSKVAIDYGPAPADAQFRTIYESMKQQQVLERLQQFLAPLRLTRTLTVRMVRCGDNVLYRPYVPGGDVTICYEFIKQVEDLAPSQGYMGAVGVVVVPRSATIIGPIVEEVLHDVALAVFDNLQVPVWGRPEDAADYVAALIMLQFGPDVAQTTIYGTAYFLYAAGNNVDYTEAYVVDVRPPVRQRYYNILCVAYGRDPNKFPTLRVFNRPELPMDLPTSRAGECAWRNAQKKGDTPEGEYEKLEVAFKQLILDPYVDPELLKKVMATDWLKIQ
jgi:hypothetical protein